MSSPAAPAPRTIPVQKVCLVSSAAASLCTHTTSGSQRKKNTTNTTSLTADMYPPYSRAAMNKSGINCSVTKNNQVSQDAACSSSDSLEGHLQLFGVRSVFIGFFRGYGTVFDQLAEVIRNILHAFLLRRAYTLCELVKNGSIDPK